jgi:DNA end-binding protein Ku
VLGLIERKAAGEADLVTAVEAPSNDKVIDLMAALEASVQAAKAARSRHPAARETALDDAAPAEQPAATKKSAARKRKSA